MSDAAVGPEVDEDDVAAEGLQGQRRANIEPLERTGKLRRAHPGSVRHYRLAGIEGAW
jgi:hypothetical protein